MAALDLETTSPEPEEARIVTAAFALVGGGEPTETRTWLADPGVEIPEEASAIHGVTTERAQAEGQEAPEVAYEVADAVARAAALGRPLVIYNARYDLTVLDREMRRHWRGVERGVLDGLRVVDPLVLDRHLDRYRKTKDTGSRRLQGACDHYARRWENISGQAVKSPLGGSAHNAAADALAAAWLAVMIAALDPKDAVVRRVRNSLEAVEKHRLKGEWTEVREDLDALHAFQRRLAEEERVRFAEYKRSIGDEETAAKVEAERGWPVLELPAGVD
jgi:DNA polymerase III subunit epsilon